VAVRIAVTTYRECCELEDLRTKDGKSLRTVNRHKDDSQLMWCMHCGKEHEYYRYTDAAGSADWDYRPTGNKINPCRVKGKQS
jgi:hypothetical protein